jgi:hypothetical protein
MRGACHCGAVRFEIESPPTWTLDCNCTLCRRYGGMWTYLRGEGAVTLTIPPTPGATETYLWGDRELAFHRCKVCGCVTHMEAVAADPPFIYGLNARLLVGLDPATVLIREVDNGHSGFFWTASPQPPIKSRHPPMPPPGPGDWR